MDWKPTGATIDAAYLASDRLGVLEDELEIQVLTEPVSTMFGLKKRNTGYGFGGDRLALKVNLEKSSQNNRDRNRKRSNQNRKNTNNKQK